MLTELASLSTATVSASWRLRASPLRRWIERYTIHALKNAATNDGNPMPMPIPKLILSDSVIPLPVVFAAAGTVGVGLVVTAGPDLPEELATTAELRADD